ncbi:hypothetical protein AAVH_15916 [Aphelenchoides avenae]|nr:hypothetical protein AAVH_15916 [Aphelenchus avenae]
MSHDGAGGTSQEQGIHAFELNDFDMSHKPVVTGSHIKHWVLKCWILMWVGSCVINITSVTVAEIKIKRYVDNMGEVSHQGTRKMHRDFHRALLAMAICPLVTSAGPILYYMFAAFMELSPGPNQAFLTMAVSSITMVNPLTTIFFMRSYRQVVLKPFLKKKANKVGTCVTGLSMATSTFVPSPSASASS